MANNNKQTSKPISSLASQALRNPAASPLQKSLAASALAQSGNKHQTSSAMEQKASQALQSGRSSDITKALAGSVLSQANKKR